MVSTGRSKDHPERTSRQIRVSADRRREIIRRAPARSVRAPAIAACLVAGIVLIVGLPALRNSFVDLDDQTYVANKPVSSGLTIDGLSFAFTSLSPYWHPVTWLSHELDAELSGRHRPGITSPACCCTPSPRVCFASPLRRSA